MIQRSRPHVRLNRREVFRRDNFTCQYCGRRDVLLTIDHVLPRHLGGAYVWTNVVTACAPCNHRKGGRRLEDAHMSLTHTPKEPPASTAYLFAHHLDENLEWEPFIKGW
jgi:5-methylcytosine-specific restriction endonuclease McrA